MKKERVVGFFDYMVLLNLFGYINLFFILIIIENVLIFFLIGLIIFCFFCLVDFINNIEYIMN